MITAIVWRATTHTRSATKFANWIQTAEVKAVHTTVDEVLYIGGKRYFRPLEKDGKPIATSDSSAKSRRNSTAQPMRPAI